ncbi:hypothetical protein [Streptomyces sp. NBC_01142]|uniref:hypothetical protein n=1 Tax=Streptomyces sp. NBC_01142 TaxID=2975865 RepID=UPI002B1D680A|nr:hypothetical protein [Streptomyces sp. NBC_01142]
MHLQQEPHEPLLATLTALRPPHEPYPAVLVVLQSDAAHTARAAGHRRPLPDLAEATRNAELMDLLDSMTTALLRRPAVGSNAPSDGDGEGALAVAAGVLAGRMADWVIADVSADGSLRRTAVLGPAGADPHRLLKKITEQDPAACPLVVEAARGGSAALQVRPEDLECFGRDDAGASVLVQAEVTSLLCVPVQCPQYGGGPVLGVLTLFRTGAGRAFSMAEARAVDVVSHHIALAMRRPA